jgi:hypothetical protein
VTCRVARSFQDQLCTDLSFCCACGSKKLEAFYTLKTVGPHLCRICAQSGIKSVCERQRKERLCSVNAAEDCLSAKPSMN